MLPAVAALLLGSAGVAGRAKAAVSAAHRRLLVRLAALPMLGWVATQAITLVRPIVPNAWPAPAVRTMVGLSAALVAVALVAMIRDMQRAWVD